MPNIELQNRWNQVCDRVTSYNGVDISQFKALLDRIQIQAMSDGFLLLTVENSFLKSWFDKQFGQYIQQALNDLYNIPFTVVIEVDEPSANNSNTLDTNESLQSFNQPTIQPQQPTQTTVINNQETTSVNSFENKNDVLVNSSINPIENTNINSVETSQINETQTNNTISNAPLKDQSLNSFTFENFVAGESNRLALSMAIQVAEVPGKNVLNPLFIYGKSGLGKTHLMRAIQNYINETQPYLHTIYVDSEELISRYTDAATQHDKEKSSYKNFKSFYESADVLLIDDIQFLQGKNQTLDIVFQIFNKLIEQGKQIVLSADRAPKNIDIEERYSSRFIQGGTIDIQPPEIETKLGIINNYIEDYKKTENNPNLKISEDIRIYIAENSGSNIRELKGAITILIYHIMNVSEDNTISLNDAVHLLENHLLGGVYKNLTIDDIQKEVENFYKIKHSDITGSSRSKSVVVPRQIAMYLCRQLLDKPFEDIGKKFNRDHSTVMHSVTKIEENLLKERDLQEEIEVLKKLIKDL